MRSQIFLADITNLTEVSVVDEQSNEQTVHKIQPNVVGEISLTAAALTALSDGLNTEPNPDARLIILVTTDLVPVFRSPEFENYFDPVARIDDIERGNIGAVLGLQVIEDSIADHSYVAVACVLDTEEGVTVEAYNAANVKL